MSEQVGAETPVQTVLGEQPAETPAETPAEPTWTDGLEGEDLGFIQNKGFKSLDEAVKSYRNAEQFLGVPADRLVKLPENLEAAEAEVQAEIFKKLGWPEKAEDYGLQPQADAPEGTIDLAPKFAEWAHEAHLLPHQVHSVVEKFNAHMTELREAQQQAVVAQTEAAQATLRKQWGAAYDDKVAAADRFMQKVGWDQPTVEALRDAMGAQWVLELTATLGEGLGEAPFVSGEAAPTGGVMTPEQAKARIAQLRTDSAFQLRLYGDEATGGNRRPELAAQQEWRRLLEMAHPEG
jgi:hypothetical protein